MTFGRGLPTLAHQGRRWAASAWTRGTSSSARGVQSHCGRRGRHLQLDAASWRTPWMGERIDLLMSQITSPEQVTLAWDGNLSTAGSWSATLEGRSGSRFFLSISATSHWSLTGSSLASALNAACFSLGGPAIPCLWGAHPGAIRARSSLVSLGHHQSSPEPSFFTRPGDRKRPMVHARQVARSLSDGACWRRL